MNMNNVNNNGNSGDGSAYEIDQPFDIKEFGFLDYIEDPVKFKKVDETAARVAHLDKKWGGGVSLSSYEKIPGGRSRVSVDAQTKKSDARDAGGVFEGPMPLSLRALRAIIVNAANKETEEPVTADKIIKSNISSDSSATQFKEMTEKAKEEKRAENVAHKANRLREEIEMEERQAGDLHSSVRKMSR